MAKQIDTNASLPAKVRYHSELSNFSKILFAELYLRAGKKRSCYPSNRLLASLFGVTSRTVQRALAELEKEGYLVTKNFKTDEGYPRRNIDILIKVKSKPRQNNLTNTPKLSGVVRQKLHTRYDRN